MNPQALYFAPCHTINVETFGIVATTMVAFAVVCFHRKAEHTSWFKRMFGPEYEHVHIGVIRTPAHPAWTMVGPLGDNSMGVVPGQVQDVLNLRFDQATKNLPRPSAADMLAALDDIMPFWISTDTALFAEGLMKYEDLGRAVRAFAKVREG